MMVGRGIALVADGHELFRMGLSETLKREFSFERVCEAGDMADAIRYLETNSNISIACLNPRMAGVCSISDFRTLRRRFPSVKIVLVSDSVCRFDVLHAFSACVHGIIPKTFSAKQIHSAIQYVMGGNSFIPSWISDVPDMDQLGDDGLGLWDPTKTQVSLTKTLEVRSAPDRPVEDFRAKGLTPRQKEVLRLLSQGRSNKEIARTLSLSESTVKVHAHALFQTLGVNSRLGAVLAQKALDPNNGGSALALVPVV